MGVGQLGSRYLQGLAQINKDVRVSLVDPNPSALDLARKRYEEMPSNSHILSVNYHQDTTGMKGRVDLAIIATNSDVRLQVIENLLDKFEVNYLILEKVVFQSVEDFEYIMPILKRRKIRKYGGKE